MIKGNSEMKLGFFFFFLKKLGIGKGFGGGVCFSCSLLLSHIRIINKINNNHNNNKINNNIKKRTLNKEKEENKSSKTS